jgi:competence protein ComEA
VPWRSDGLSRRAAERLAALTNPPPLGGWVPEQHGHGDQPPVSAGDAAPVPPATRAWSLGRPQARLVVAGCALAVLAALAGLWLGRARPLPAAAADAPLAPAATLATGTPLPGLPAATVAPTATAPPGPPGVVVVDVAGKVRRPGVVTLPTGSRVLDALTAAGGARRGVDVTALNLARVLVDGEQLRVGLPPAPAGSGPTGGGAAAPAGPAGAAGQPEPVDLNAATAAALEELPGVGPVLAERIVAWREQHGRFTAVDELTEVSGIGPRVLEELRPLVRV